jgi:hypothetical protein
MPNRTGASLRRGRRGKTVDLGHEDETPAVDHSEENVDTDTDQTYSDNDTNTPDDTESSDTTTTDIDKDETMTATDAPAVPDFANLIEDAPQDYQPERASAGRKREPSPFDEIVAKVKDKGWKRVPFDGTEDQAKLIRRQLQKAQQLHDLGMDLNQANVVGDGDNGVPVGETRHYVEFKIRDKQPREKKNSAGEGGDTVAVGAGQAALDENASADGAGEGYDASDRDE